MNSLIEGITIAGGNEVYHYKTDLGILWIHLHLPGVYELRLDHKLLGAYHSPEAAANDVARRNTGCTAWDEQVSVEKPTSLSEWGKGAPYIEYEEDEEEDTLTFRDGPP